MDNAILKILKEDWEQKKSFEANWPSRCNVANDGIEEGDTFFFYGDKKKCCLTCYDEIIKGMEEGYSGASIVTKAAVRDVVSYYRPQKRNPDALPKNPVVTAKKKEKEVDPADFMAEDLPF